MSVSQVINTVSAGLRSVVPEPLKPLGSAARESLVDNYDRLFYERPDRSFRKEIIARATLPGFVRHAQELDRDGLTFIPNCFTGDRLGQLQKEFERLVATNPPGHGEETNTCHIPTRRIGESRLFGQLAFEQTFLDLADYYWGKPSVLMGTGGTRIEPFQPDEDYGSYQWHHDAKRKQFRVMILLCDVPAGGQHMDFIPGSHREFRRDLSNSRVAPDVALGLGNPVHCCGNAGTLVAFDTNGIHRGNRNLGPRRDHWQYTYRAPGSVALGSLPKLDLHKDVVLGLTAEQRCIAQL